MDIAGFTTVLIAIASHQWIEAFALGVTMMRNDVEPLRMVKLVALYSSMVPFGLLMGTILSYVLMGTVGVWVRASLTSIAAGTFIYVSAIDILLEEFGQDKSQKYLKFVTVCFGFLLLCGVKLLFDSDFRL
jgi:zinc transporter ZupT